MSRPRLEYAVGAREELLERVIAHVAETGLSDQSLRELAAGADTSHRMLLYHFDSRAGLVAAIAGRIEAGQRATLAELAEQAHGPADLQRRLWVKVSDPALAPFVRLFFDVLALALTGTPGTERFRADFVGPWLDEAAKAGSAVNLAPDRTELRLGIAVTRGLLADALVTGDVAAATAAHERFIELWEAGRNR